MVSFLLAMSLCVGAPDDSISADVVIRGATLHDGGGGKAVVGDIAIRGERIVGVGEFSYSGTPRVIDGQGLIVAPGFIDLHNHSDEPITREATRQSKNFLLQGCTTLVTGNCGGGRDDVGSYLEKLDRQPPGLNIAHLVPHGGVRRNILGSARRPPTADELARMKQVVAQGMRDGAFGMSTGLIYTPGSFAETDELIELSKVVAEYGGIYVSHMRNESTKVLQSIEETLTIGRRANLPVHISHFKVSGRRAWGLAAEAVRMVVAARENGDRVTADQYPYVASSTSLAAMVVPEEYRSTEELKAALDDASKREAVQREITQSIDDRDGGKSLFIAKYDANPAWQGKDLATLAVAENKSVLELVIEIQLHGGAKVVSFGMNEEEVRLIMMQPFVATASDGSAMNPDDTVPHPRSYGTFPRKIGLYGIEQARVSVEEAVRSSSGLPADILGMTDRGYLKPGYFADIVVFDPGSFRDVATFDQPHQYSTGVRYLFVNGQLAVDGGQVTTCFSGRALRKGSPKL